ncbi:winged helix-turn-helix domain-containing protein [Colwelliaceae bacterium MEBiC 14330]
MGFSDKDFTFSNVVVQPRANLLIKNNKEKRIETKVMSLLILLVSRSEEVVTRHEISTSLWPNVVVGDEGISQLIYSLRNALGDDAKNPQYIETIPKKGYRFIAEVKILEKRKTSSVLVNKIPKSLENKTRAFYKVKWLVSSAFVVLLTLLLFWGDFGLFSGTDKTKPITGDILPVTQQNGAESDFAFFKGHKKMVFAQSSNIGMDLFLKDLNTNQIEQITDDIYKEYSPIWLNKNTLAYIRIIEKNYQIIRHELGASPEVLFESKNYISHIALNASTPDELTFIEYDYYQHNKLNEVKLLNLNNTDVRLLQDPQFNLPNAIHSLIYSQDGEIMYFYANNDERTEIIALDLNNNEAKTISTAFSFVDHISLIDRNYLLVSGQLSTTKGIWRVNISNNTVTSVLPSITGQKIVHASIKDGFLFYATHSAPLNQNLVDFNSQLIDELPYLNSNANETVAIFSNDSSGIYFVSDRTGYYEIWYYNLENQQVQQISNIKAKFITRPVLSKNEDYLALIYKTSELTLAIMSTTNGELVNKKSIPSMKYILAWGINDEQIFISEHKRHVNIYQYDSASLDSSLIQKQAGLFAKQSKDGQSLTLVDYKLAGVTKLNLTNGQLTPQNNAIASLTDLVPGQMRVVDESIISLKVEGPKRGVYSYPLINSELKGKANRKKLLMNLPNWSFVTDFNAYGTKALFTNRTPPQGDIMKIAFNH